MRPDLETRIVQPTVPPERRETLLQELIDRVAAALEEGDE